MPVEIERTYTSQKFVNNDGTLRLTTHIKPIFYDNAGLLEPIEIALFDAGSHFETLKNNARVYINKSFLASQLILWDNKFLSANQNITFDARQLLWVNKNDYTDFQVFRSPQDVFGTMISPTTIRYENAYGPGIHFEITITRTQFRKEIVIDSLGSLVAPPTQNHLLVLAFKWGGNLSKIVRSSDNTEFNGSVLEATGTDFILDGKSALRGAVIEDAARRKVQSIPIFFRETAQGLLQFKVIPRSFLTDPDTVFPVRADATGTYWTTASDRILRSNSTTGLNWTACRDGDSPAVVDFPYNTATTGYGPDYNEGGGNDILWFPWFDFDTSGLGSDSTITAARLYTYTDTRTLEAGGTAANCKASITKYTPGNIPPSATADWDGQGKTILTDEKDWSTIANGGWNTWTFTSYGDINKTGSSYFSNPVKEFYENSSTRPPYDYYAITYFSESSSDPYLEVDYTTTRLASTNDSITAGESITTSQASYISPSESIVIGESPNATLVNVVSVTDTISMTDLLSMLTEFLFEITKTENIQIGEVISSYYPLRFKKGSNPEGGKRMIE